MDNKKLAIIANDIRRDIVEMLYHAGTGHPGGALGMSDIFTILYFDIMKDQSKKPYSKTRDFVILSNGHICPVLYATLSRKGYFKRDELFTLRKLNSRLQGHPHYISPAKNGKMSSNMLPGVENSGGPLGQGFSQAVGLAADLKRDNKKNRVYCFTGDGELNEGQCYEAALFASKESLDNLIVIVDRNKIQIDGATEDVLPLGDLAKKFSSLGFYVIEFNGNNLNQIKSAFKKGMKVKGKPICLLANTTPGKGVSFMEKNFKWHGKVTSVEETEKAMKDLDKISEKLKRTLTRSVFS